MPAQIRLDNNSAAGFISTYEALIQPSVKWYTWEAKAEELLVWRQTCPLQQQFLAS